MPGAPGGLPRGGLNGDEEGEVQWVAVEAPPSTVPEDLQRVADAAEAGDVQALEEALSNLTVSVDTHAEDGDTPLHLAALHGHTQCLQMLLDRGASVIARDEDGAIPLHDAAASGYSACIEGLLSAATHQGCTQEMLRAKDVDGDTPLHHAARGNHVLVIDQLLAAGADADIGNASGRKPYQLADNPSAVEKLQRPLASES